MYVEKKYYLCRKITNYKRMKRILFFSLCLVVCTMHTYAEKTWAQYERYSADNDSLIAMWSNGKYVAPTAVLMGNSITDSWATMHPEFFAENNLIGRGISGQVTTQMLARFQADVVALHPRKVVILAGANDLAQNKGYISHEHIMQNIQSMCELAKQHKIRPVLCSCLPAASFFWRPELNAAEDIVRLNEMIKAYAKSNRIKYIDYYSALVDEHGGLPKKYTKDGVHPNMAGYAIMEEILLKHL